VKVAGLEKELADQKKELVDINKRLADINKKSADMEKDINKWQEESVDTLYNQLLPLFVAKLLGDFVEKITKSRGKGEGEEAPSIGMGDDTIRLIANAASITVKDLIHQGLDPQYHVILQSITRVSIC
jgi:hypothetical protein